MTRDILGTMKQCVTSATRNVTVNDVNSSHFHKIMSNRFNVIQLNDLSMVFRHNVFIVREQRNFLE